MKSPALHSFLHRFHRSPAGETVWTINARFSALKPLKRSTWANGVSSGACGGILESQKLPLGLKIPPGGLAVIHFDTIFREKVDVGTTGTL